LPVAVATGRSGLLVTGHRAPTWASALALAVRSRSRLAAGAVAHAREFSWDRTTDALVAGYADAATAFRRALFEAEVAV
jgi:D-inositol-3-phosphate glycosyltransferase